MRAPSKYQAPFPSLQKFFQTPGIERPLMDYLQPILVTHVDCTGACDFSKRPSCGMWYLMGSIIGLDKHNEEPN